MKFSRFLSEISTKSSLISLQRIFLNPEFAASTNTVPSPQKGSYIHEFFHDIFIIIWANFGGSIHTCISLDFHRSRLEYSSTSWKIIVFQAKILSQTLIILSSCQFSHPNFSFLKTALLIFLFSLFTNLIDHIFDFTSSFFIWIPDVNKSNLISQYFAIANLNFPDSHSKSERLFDFRIYSIPNFRKSFSIFNSSFISITLITHHIFLKLSMISSFEISSKIKNSGFTCKNLTFGNKLYNSAIESLNSLHRINTNI
ncbi:MAG: hypothetical protein ACD_4C00410G0001 [uncultured bacterium (gcode 4)]|uniref:Uncharacterized protein n=1 Tax=uncultured bacterium (gcode 4) TaxID=1234023 RepID=K2FTG0_9BACT|nr:MAG: hypothetical protein ACD_4C00410G0001 [uncultured bacterium (gcode 4)]